MKSFFTSRHRSCRSSAHVMEKAYYEPATEVLHVLQASGNNEGVLRPKKSRCWLSHHYALTSARGRRRRIEGTYDPTASQASSLVRFTYWSQAYSAQRPAFVHVSPQIPSSRLRHTGKMTSFIMCYLPRRSLCVREDNDDEWTQDIQNCLSVLHNTQHQ